MIVPRAFFVFMMIFLFSVVFTSMAVAESYHPDENLIQQYRSLDDILAAEFGAWADEMGIAKESPLIERSNDQRIQSLDISPDGRFLATVGFDAVVILWDIGTGRPILKFDDHGSHSLFIKFAPDGRRLFAGLDDGRVIAWNLVSGKIVFSQDLDGMGEVTGIAFSLSSNTILASTVLSERMILDLESGQVLYRFSSSSSTVQDRMSSPEGKYFVLNFIDDYRVHLIDARTGETVRSFDGHSDNINALAFSPDGRYLASGSHDTTIIIRETESGEVVSVLKGHQNHIRSISFSPDGTQILTTSGDDTVRLWDPATGFEIQRYEGHSLIPTTAIFSADGTYIRSYGYGWHDGEYLIWETDTGELVRKLDGFGRTDTGAAFLPDESGVLHGAREVSVVLFDPANGRTTMEFAR